jgi:uncharacterized protein (TIRG00374 family)
VFAIAGVVFIRVLQAAEVRSVYGLLKAIGPELILALVPYLLVVGFETAGWKAIVNVLTRSVSFLGLLVARLATELVQRVVPGGPVLAETLKPIILKNKMPVSETTATVALNKIVTVAMHGVYVGVALALNFGDFRALSQALIHSALLPWLTLFTAVLMVVAAWIMGAVVLHGSLATRLHRLLVRIPAQRLRDWLILKESSFLATDQHVVDLMRARKAPLTTSAAFSLAGWIAESIETFVMLQLLGVPLGFRSVLTFESVVSILRSLAFFVPGSLGIQDFSYMAFLRAYGIDNATNVGAAFVVLKRAKEACWIGIGFAAAFIANAFKTSKPDESPTI